MILKYSKQSINILNPSKLWFVSLNPIMNLGEHFKVRLESNVKN